jgi:hypothetical protein
VLTSDYGTRPAEIAAMEAEVKLVNHEAKFIAIKTVRLAARLIGKW